MIKPIDVVFVKGSCVFCHKVYTGGTVTQSSLDRWQDGMKIQDACPNLSEDDREFLVSGVCPKCFDTLGDDS